jgi:hypothetical protein
MAGSVPAISIPTAKQCHIYRDARDRPGMNSKKLPAYQIPNFHEPVFLRAARSSDRNSNSEISMTSDRVAANSAGHLGSLANVPLSAG